MLSHLLSLADQIWPGIKKAGIVVINLTGNTHNWMNVGACNRTATNHWVAPFNQATSRIVRVKSNVHIYALVSGHWIMG